MHHVLIVVLVAVLSLVVPRNVAAQAPARPSGSGSGSGAASGTASTPVATSSQSGTTAQTRADLERYGPKFIRSLTNVQIELTITDQTGAEKPEKKTVSMVVSSGSWGKIRSAGAVIRPGNSPAVVDLNVDARPLVSIDGPIQLELNMAYSPQGADGKEKPPTVNQSLTVILQNGKPLVISQAADPVGDRRIIVEAKATVLK